MCIRLKIQCAANMLRSPNAYQILTYEILRIGTHLITLSSLLSLLKIFFYKLHYILLFVLPLCAWYAQQPRTDIDLLCIMLADCCVQRRWGQGTMVAVG
jgi:hypothetical protein